MRNTKKLLALGLATMMMANLVACGNEPADNQGGHQAKTPHRQ